MASEERLKVLKMVQEGKISAEDAIELLFNPGRGPPPAADAACSPAAWGR
jgi:hypothetical protein